MTTLQIILMVIGIIAVIAIVYFLIKKFIKAVTRVHHLNLRAKGLTEMPAVPFILTETLATIVKLGLRNEEMLMAKSGLSNLYSFDGHEQTAYRLMYDKKPHETGKEEKENLLKALKRASEKDLLGLDKLEPHLKNAAFPKQAINKEITFTNLFLEKPEQFTMSWTNYYNIYENSVKEGLEKKYPKILTDPKEATEQFWPMISENGLAYNLLFVQKINDKSVNEVKETFKDQWDKLLAPIFEKKLLYAIDLRIFCNWGAEQAHGFDRWTPGSWILLEQDPKTKKLNPVSVWVSDQNKSNAKIYIQSDAAWLFALSAARTSVTVYGIWLGHVYHWHIVSAAMQMTLFNNVDKDHDLRKLLDPQSKSLIGFNDTLFLLWSTIGPPTSFTTTESFLELTNTFATNRDFFDDDPHVAIHKLGISKKDFTVTEDWDQYPIVGDLITIWNASKEMVEVFVETTYTDDAAVYNDTQLQNWINESANPEEGNIRGLPVVSDKKELKRVLTSVVYRVAAHGNSRQMRSLGPGLSFVANYPPCLQKTDIIEPSKKLTIKELLRYLPNTGTIGSMMTFYYIFIFSAPYEPLLPLFGNKTSLYFEDPNDPRNIALEKFRKKIGEFIETYDKESPLIHQWPASIET